MKVSLNLSTITFVGSTSLLLSEAAVTPERRMSMLFGYMIFNPMVKVRGKVHVIPSGVCGHDYPRMTLSWSRLLVRDWK